jgi:branched-chain amino acid transport system substrate-binding protein
MTKTFLANNIKPKGISWFNWGLGIHHAKLLLRKAKSSGADVIFLLAMRVKEKRLQRGC